jgi:hypothetical protein
LLPRHSVELFLTIASPSKLYVLLLYGASVTNPVNMRRSNSRNSNSMVEPPDADFMMDAEMMDDEDEDEWENGEDDYDDATNDDDDMVSLGSSVPTTVASAHEDKTTASQKARKLEQQRVFSSKLMVITAFVIVTIAVTVSIYGLSTKEQNESLESKVRNSPAVLNTLHGLDFRAWWNILIFNLLYAVSKLRQSDF